MEILIQAELDKVWQLTQQPDLHQRWDLRFTRINYLPRPDPELPQYFLYETRIGFGLSIKGTGESVGRRAANDGDTTSALRFASNDPKFLIREGSGYWRYVPAERGLRFFTWYDYQVAALAGDGESCSGTRVVFRLRKSPGLLRRSKSCQSESSRVPDIALLVAWITLS